LLFYAIALLMWPYDGPVVFTCSVVLFVWNVEPKKHGYVDDMTQTYGHANSLGSRIRDTETES